MKKVVRTVYIGALSGLAFLAACCSQNGLTRKERKQLVKERDSIQEVLKRREGAAVYGSPEIIEEYGRETNRMRQEVKSLQQQIKDLDNPQGGKTFGGDAEALYGSPMPNQ